MVPTPGKFSSSLPSTYRCHPSPLPLRTLTDAVTSASLVHRHESAHIPRPPGSLRYERERTFRPLSRVRPSRRGNLSPGHGIIFQIRLSKVRSARRALAPVSARFRNAAVGCVLRGRTDRDTYARSFGIARSRATALSNFLIFAAFHRVYTMRHGSAFVERIYLREYRPPCIYRRTLIARNVRSLEHNSDQNGMTSYSLARRKEREEANKRWTRDKTVRDYAGECSRECNAYKNFIVRTSSSSPSHHAVRIAQTRRRRCGESGEERGRESRRI